MPCAAGELCLIPDQSLGPNQGHGCRGGCGGRLHGLCGEQEEEDGSELYRICPTCASKRFAGAASKAAAGKRKARENATSGSKRKKGGAGKKADRTAPRTRLSVEEKMALLVEVDKAISQETVAGRFKCAVRTVQSIKQNRKDIQKQADTARGSRKSNRPGEFKRLYSAGYALYRRKSMLCGCPV